MKRIQINITEPLDCSGARNGLVLDPEDRSVDIFSNVGAGTPERVWHGRAIMLPLGNSYVVDSLRDVVEANLDTIDAIFATYKGSEWNGSNYVGSWEHGYEDEDGYEDEYHDCEHVRALEEALEDVETTWDASDYFSGDWGTVKEEAGEALRKGEDAFAAYVQHEEAEALAQGIHLHGAEHALRHAAQEYEEDRAEEDDR